MDEAIRKALGIEEDADPVAAITSLQAKITELTETLETDVNSVDKTELRGLRNELAEVQREHLSQESEWERRVISLEEDNRREKAERMVNEAISAGRVQPALKEMALKLALRDPDDFEEFVAQLTGVDLREHGVATDADMADLEPTKIEVDQAIQMGVWNEEYRIKLMRQKAKAKGMALPAELGEKA